MTRLCELAEKYGSDKTAKYRHPYTPFYDELLRGREVKRVLEIGIGTPVCMNPFVNGYKTGASLYMWSEYFPQAEIWGLDNDMSALFDDGNIHTRYCDQSNVESLVNVAQILGGFFDLIIDDGSHVLEHQALTANTLAPILLSKTGVYVIEDVMFPRELSARLRWGPQVEVFDIERTPDDRLFILYGSQI